MLRRLLSIGQTSEKNNKAESNNRLHTTGKAIAKKIATIALAFSAQYGALIGTEKANAQEVQSSSIQLSQTTPLDSQHNTIQEIETSELGTLDEVDRDFYQVDPIHSVENGITIFHGTPVLLRPFVNVNENNQSHFHMYEEAGAINGDISDKVEGLSKMFSTISNDKKVRYSDAVSFVEIAEKMEKRLPMNNLQKIRHYYQMTYFWSTMSKWKWEDSGDNKMMQAKDISKMDQDDLNVQKYIEICNKDREDSEIARYTGLLNEVLDQPEYKGKPKYERMRREAKLMKLLDLVNNFANLAADGDVIREDLVNFVQREGYLDYLESGLNLFEDTMNAFESGDQDVSRDFLAVQRRMFHTFLVSDRRFAKAFNALPDVKMTELEYHTILLAINESTEKRVFQLLKRYHELVEKPHEYNNKQHFVSHILYADDMLKYAEAVSQHDSIFAQPGAPKQAPKLASADLSGSLPVTAPEIAVPAKDVEKFLKSVLSTTETIKEKYPTMQDLLLPETTLDNVTQVASRVNEALPRYKAISDGEMAAERLTRFIAKTEGDTGTLTPGEKLELLDIFQAVQDSPMKEKAEQRLVAAMHQAVYLEQDANKTNIRVERAEDTGFTYDFKANPVYLETNGVTELTTVQPADKLFAQYTFVNKFRFDLPVQIQIYYPNTRVVMQNVDVVLRSNKETEVNYTAILAAIPSARSSGSDQKLPDYQMQLASAKIPQMLGSDPEVQTMLAARSVEPEKGATYVASTPSTMVGYGTALQDTPLAPLNITTGVVVETK